MSQYDKTFNLKINVGHCDLGLGHCDLGQKKKVSLFTIVRPSLFFSADPKFFFHYSLGIPKEYPVWPYYPHIKTFNKIKIFCDLPTLFNYTPCI